MADRIGIIVDLTGATEAYNSIMNLTQAVNNLNGRNVNINVNGVQFNQRAQEAQNFASSLNMVADALDHLGSLSGSVANFSSSIGNAFTQMNSIFKTDVGSTILKTLTYNATNYVTGNLSQAASRYDILNTFTQYMNLAGVSTPVANNALNRVNESILGLPIGLDEAAQRLRRYQMFVGDTNAATDLTIGVQNAIMAGGASTAAKTQTYNLIERLLSTGGLTNVRQWQSLLVGLGVSQQFIAQELGVDPKNLLNDLSSKAISTDQFLAALQRLGTGATEAAVKLNDALGIYKNTLEAWAANIQFAFTRGNANMLNAVNESLSASTGMGIIDYMRELRDGVNDVYGSAQSFVRGNPQLLGDFVADVRSLLEVVSGFSGSEFVRGVMEHMGTLMEIVGNSLSRIPQGKLEEFASFAVTLAGPIGKLFSAVSSGAPVMMGIFERFKDYDWQAQVDEIIDAGAKLADVVYNLLDLIDDPVMQKLIAYGLVWGKPVQSFLSAISGGLREISSAIMFFNQTGISLTGIGTGIGGLVASLAPYAGILGLVGLGAIPYSQNDDALSKIVAQHSGSRLELLKFVNDIRAGNTPYGFDEQTSYVLQSLAENALEDYTGPLGANGGVRPHEFGLVTAQAEEYADALEEVGQAYTSIADEAAESVSVQIGLFDELTAAAAKSFSDLFSAWQSNTDINNRWAEALNTLMGYGIVNPESMAAIQALVEEGPESALATAESWVEEIASGRGLGETTEKFNEYAQSAESAAYATELLKAAFAEGAEFDFDTALSIAAEQLGVSADEITDRFTRMWGDSETITADGLANIINTIRNGFNGATSAIKNGGSQASKAAQKAVDDIRKALNSLNVDSSKAEATIAQWGWAVTQGIISAKQLAVAAALDATSAINSALSGLNASTTRASLRTGPKSGAVQSPYANGGLIYAANGQLIDFLPVGTDTIPAMLTPGEFVLRRAAVNRVGLPFLERLNSLDMGGAFDRAIKTGVFNTGGMVRNYYRDNHAQVTMINNNASQDYSMRRMGRYVRSL